MHGFDGRLVKTARGSVFLSEAGAGPPVLLLHGFPETHLMWRDIAPALARDFAVVAPDLPGYGRSDCPVDLDHHDGMSKRAMAASLVEMMGRLGHSRFSVVGHDRGGRVAYRMALDHPQAVISVAVLDIIPTSEVWERADARLMLAFWPFSLLAQEAPLPELLIMRSPEAVVDNALGCWGSPQTAFPSRVRQAYVDALSDPAHVHAICEDYRAAAGIDRDHDIADRKTGRRIVCPLLALWSGTGGLSSWYDEAGGPLGLWSRWADDVRGQPVDGGHFFPEESPGATARLLHDFLMQADGRCGQRPGKRA